jgi:hypothetical protein
VTVRIFHLSLTYPYVLPVTQNVSPIVLHVPLPTPLSHAFELSEPEDPQATYRYAKYQEHNTARNRSPS